jgi:hypothetical protein
MLAVGPMTPSHTTTNLSHLHQDDSAFVIVVLESQISHRKADHDMMNEHGGRYVC